MVETLEEHIGDAEDDPDMHSFVNKMRTHITETQKQADYIKQLLENMGEDPSTIKTEAAKAQAKAMAVSLDVFKDNGVKNIIMDHASEHFEMATYLAIKKAAEICQNEQVAKIAEEIMNKEKTTAEEVEKEIGKAVESYFNKIGIVSD